VIDPAEATTETEPQVLCSKVVLPVRSDVTRASISPSSTLVAARKPMLPPSVATSKPAASVIEPFSAQISAVPPLPVTVTLPAPARATLR